MTAQYFIDSNILLYAGSQHPDDQAKRNIALAILRKPDLGFSTQVMQEYFYVAYAKKRLGISLKVALENLEWLSQRNTLSMTPDLVVRSTRLAAHHHISYWDGAIIAAALDLKCHTLYSEDLNHGQDYGGVRVINPFREEASQSTEKLGAAQRDLIEKKRRLSHRLEDRPLRKRARDKKLERGQRL